MKDIIIGIIVIAIIVAVCVFFPKDVYGE